MKKSYSVDKKIDKNEIRYVLHLLIETEKGANLIGVFSGTRNECYEMKRKLEGEDKKDEKKKRC